MFIHLPLPLSVSTPCNRHVIRYLYQSGYLAVEVRATLRNYILTRVMSNMTEWDEVSSVLVRTAR